MVRTPGMSKRAPRIDVRRPATIVNSDGNPIRATLLDMSGSGFRVQFDDKLNIGEFIEIHVGDEIMPAKIRWVLGDEAGGAFLGAIGSTSF